MNKNLTRQEVYEILVKRGMGELLSACVADEIDPEFLTEKEIKTMSLSQILWSGFLWGESKTGLEFWEQMAEDVWEIKRSAK
jgi:hypothetical protein